MSFCLKTPSLSIIYFLCLVFLFIIFCTPVYAAGDTWFVRPQAVPGTYFNENGSNYNNAWNGFDNIDWTASGLQPGDTLYVCGTHHDTFLEIKGSGNDGSPIIIDGGCPGSSGASDPGVIVSAKDVSDAGNWSQIPGTNKWATADNSFSNWLDTDTPGDECYYNKLPGHAVLIDAYGNPGCDNNGFNICPTSSPETAVDGAVWWQAQSQDTCSGGWNVGRMVMYMSPDAYGQPRDPGTVFSTIIIPNHYAALYAYGQSYVKINNITIRHAKHGIWMRNAEHFHVDNAHVSVYGGGSSGNGIMFSGNARHSSIKNSYAAHGFDVGLDLELFDDDIETAYDVSFLDNTVEFCGGGIAVSAHASVESKIYDVTVKGNTFRNLGMGWSGSDLTYSHGKGISMKEVAPADLDGIIVEDNVVDGYTWIGINMWGGNAVIQRNVIKNGTASYSGAGLSEHTGIQLHGGDYTPSGNSPDEVTAVIANNIILNNEGHGIYIINNTPDPASEGDVRIFHNTLYSNGYHDGLNDYATYHLTTSLSTYFKNNIIYNGPIFINGHDYPVNSTYFKDKKGRANSTVSDYNIFHTDNNLKEWSWYKTAYTALGDFYDNSGNDCPASRCIPALSYDASPNFENPALYRFYLQPGSPGAGSGATDIFPIEVPDYDYTNPAYPEGQRIMVELQLQDICGNNVYTAAPDIGAFEGTCLSYVHNLGLCSDIDTDGYYSEGGPCGEADQDDSDATVYPGAPEIPGDGKDNDQDGLIDEVITWTGATSADWDTAGNWDLDVVPQSSDNVIIVDAPYGPGLASAVTVNNLTIESGELTLDGYDLKVGLVIE